MRSIASGDGALPLCHAPFLLLFLLLLLLVISWGSDCGGGGRTLPGVRMAAMRGWRRTPTGTAVRNGGGRREG